ncbi:hypothetical protein KWG76_13745 [Haloterrigena longa]|uniref:Uncharacterized protein n=2 Tax=Natrinema longum TaxID=370324 RepID=A0A8A2UEH0_9EURY|nr:hypothetical protein [Natrinema longum]QSW86944.1 hypothetical protein J0X27_04480 [Natrinema longum]
MIVLPILGPQLYLAVTDRDGEHAPRTRIRTPALVSLSLLPSFLAVADGTDRTILGLLAGGVALGYLCYEGGLGYRRAREA